MTTAAQVGLSERQYAHAKVMIAEVKRRNLTYGHRAALIVMETALVESNLTIYANANVPGSMSLPHEAVGYDHRSVGIMQQQSPSWGTPADCMNPTLSTRKFLDGAGNNPGLLHLPRYRFTFVGRGDAVNWWNMSTGQAAQAVQVSAFPSRYQDRLNHAAQIVDSLWSVAPTKPAPAVAKVYYTIRSGDTLSAIAKSHHTTVARLVSLNKIKNANLIYAGQRLRIK
jgi:hypothetical protein